MLGGTDFVGPAVVNVAVARGHDVTLFNRGETNPELFTWLEQLRGDRNPETETGLSALKGDRSWDLVIDTWQGTPLAVAASADLLEDRVGAYFYVSSIAVYQDPNYRKPSFDESAELPEAAMPEQWDQELPYPVRKQLGEQVVIDRFGDRFATFRAYGIQGTDGRGRLPGFNYWPLRIATEGGVVLAPGDGKDYTAWTDVRDLADFIVHCAENRIRGAYNVGAGATLEQYLNELTDLSPQEVELRWAPVPFLREHDLGEFVDVPGWIWRESWGPGFYRASMDRALAAGLRPRTVRQMIGPLIDAYRLHHGDHELRDPENAPAIAVREAELLEKLEGWSPGSS